MKKVALVLTALVALGSRALVASELRDIFACRAQDVAALRKGFAQPPREAQPWVYWFWWNSVVSREEIAHELEELATAGFGGAEIRVATFHGWGGKPLAGMDAANLERPGHRKLTYLSDEWADMMEFTCAKAQQLGLRLALNLGQGWPPGGPWITDEHRTKHLTWKPQQVKGPTTEAMRHDGRVVDADFTADGSRVLTASWDRTVKIWDARPLSKEQRFDLPLPVVFADFAPDGRAVLTGTGQAIFTAGRNNAWHIGGPQRIAIQDLARDQEPRVVALPPKAGIVAARFTSAWPRVLISDLAVLWG